MYKVYFPSAFHNNYFINSRTPPGFITQHGRIIVVGLLLRKAVVQKFYTSSRSRLRVMNSVYHSPQILPSSLEWDLWQHPDQRMGRPTERKYNFL